MRMRVVLFFGEKYFLLYIPKQHFDVIIVNNTQFNIT